MKAERIIKTKAGKANYIWNSQELEILAEALLTIKNKQKMINFLQDLLTSMEISDILRRFLVAYLILKGFTYQEIEDGCGMNPNTISKIKQKLFFSKKVLKEVLENFVIKEFDEAYQKIVEEKSRSRIDKERFRYFKPVVYGHRK